MHLWEIRKWRREWCWHIVIHKIHRRKPLQCSFCIAIKKYFEAMQWWQLCPNKNRKLSEPLEKIKLLRHSNNIDYFTPVFQMCFNCSNRHFVTQTKWINHYLKSKEKEEKSIGIIRQKGLWFVHKSLYCVSMRLNSYLPLCWLSRTHTHRWKRSQAT